MRIEGEGGFTRETVNWTQLQMLKRCDVPGLLPIEIEQFDGAAAFKYELGGLRMLSEALRLSKWTMDDLMNALCRLTEVLEDCRLYLLDADRVLLSDEYIFVGADWQDVRFAYLPITEKAEADRGALEKLIVRWMTRVEKPNGVAMQQVLRIVASPDFSPHELRSCIRQYFAARSSGIEHRAEEIMSSLSQLSPSLSEMPAESSEQPLLQSRSSGKPQSLSWRLLQPPSGDPQTLSGLLDDEHPVHESGEIAASRLKMDPHRRRTLIGASAALVSAIAWRYLYLDNPGQATMIACAGITVMAIAAVLLLWNGLPKSYESRPAGSASRRAMEPLGNVSSYRRFDEAPEHVSAESDFERFRIQASEQRTSESEERNNRISSSVPTELPETTWLSSGHNDLTEMLGQAPVGGDPSCYLIWESAGDGSRISLRQPSLVIGRSSDAATHIDPTNGISRAHAEVLLVSEQWRVKDLGSRNGSRLNDLPMTPYELYPLQTGDCLTLAGSKYRFVQENA